MSVEAASPQPRVFQRDLPCIHCGYSLRSISTADRCPECGKPAVDALDSLHAGNPRDIARIRLGLLLLLLAATIIPVIAGAATIGVSFLPYTYRPDSVMQPTLLASGFAIGVLGPTMACVGAFFLSTPVRRSVDGVVKRPVASEFARLTLLAAAAAYPVCGSLVWLFALATTTFFYRPRGSEEEYIIVALAATVVLGLSGWTLRNTLASARLSVFCRRSGARRSAVLFAIKKWVSGFMCGFVMAAGLVALFAYLFGRRVEDLFDTMFPSQSSARGLAAFMYIVAGILQFFVSFAFVGWMVIWPITLIITLRHLGRVGAQAALNAKGLLGAPPIDEGLGAPSAPPTAPTYRQNPHSPSPGPTGTER